ncbi:MAG: hypothetical protein ACRD0K_12660 [Egibacteraceae bacterium]
MATPGATAHATTELWLRRLADRRTRQEFIAWLLDGCDQPADLTGETVYEWETRAHAPSEFYARLLRARLGVASIAQLGLGHGPGAGAHWTWATKPERTHEVDRRRLLGLIGVAIGAHAGALLPVGPLTQAAQLLAGRGRLAVGDLDHAEWVATHLAAAYTHRPSGEVIRAAVAHARTLAALLRQASLTPDARTRLAAVASDAASLAGYSALNAGGVAQADMWFARAVSLAREAADPRLEAVALVSQAVLPGLSACIPIPGGGRRPDPLPALAIATSVAGRLPPEARAWVHGYASRELARGGDEAGSGRALDAAAAAVAAVAAVAVVDDDGPGWGWWSAHGHLGGWDGPRIQVFTAARSLVLGRHAEAASLFEQGVGGLVAPVRQMTSHKELAVCWAGIGEPERACASSATGLEIADAHGLGAQVDQLEHVRATFPPAWDHLDCVAGLDERLRQVRARASASA